MRGYRDIEKIRLITCDCGEWEEFPADMPRHHSQHFEWIENIDGEDNSALYKCPKCKSFGFSEIVKSEKS